MVSFENRSALRNAMRRISATIATFAYAVVCLTGVASASDLHLLWEDRCAECHGEAGDFAREFLLVEDGKLYGRHPDRDLRLFLQNHYLRNNDVDAVHAMLLAQATSDQQFRKKCGSCHEKAAELTRESVARRDAVLIVRDSGQPLSEFLKGHGNLEAGDIAFFLDLLDRIKKEVHRP